MTRPFDVHGCNEHREPWQSEESRARSELWRGEVAHEAQKERASPVQSNDSHGEDYLALVRLLKLAIAHHPISSQSVRPRLESHQKVAPEELLRLRASMQSATWLVVPDWFPAALRDLERLRHDTAKPNWDHEGACATAPPVFNGALTLLRKLPDFVMRPDLGVGRSGQVTMDWDASRPGYSVTAEFWPDGKVVYSALFGEDVIHGTETWHGTVPGALGLLLARLNNSEVSTSFAHTRRPHREGDLP